MDFDRVTVGERLFVGKSKPELFGRGSDIVKGTADIEGPAIIGDEKQFPAGSSDTEIATLMVAETKNSEMDPTPFYSFLAKTYTRIKSFLKVDRLLTVELIKSRIIYTDVLMARSKNFIIDHPLRKDKKLVYACLEGPENGVYFRGKLLNKNEIILPDYWKKLVDFDTITVQLQSIGSHQNLIVKRIDKEKIYLQSNNGMPINCYYHIYAERKDIEKLIIEVD
jgi:hypothetical protein